MLDVRDDLRPQVMEQATGGDVDSSSKAFFQTSLKRWIIKTGKIDGFIKFAERIIVEVIFQRKTWVRKL